MLATYTFLRSKAAEVNRNEILVDLHHNWHSFLILVPNSLPLLWSDCRSDSLVLLTFPQTKKIHFGHAWNAIWCLQTGNSLPIYMLSAGLEFPRLVEAKAGTPRLSVCWIFHGCCPLQPPASLPLCSRLIHIAWEAHSQVTLRGLQHRSAT